MHRETRVVTWSMPYVVPKDGSVRKHAIPLTAVPCLLQKRALGEHGVENGSKKVNSDGMDGPCSKVMRLDSNESDGLCHPNEEGEITGYDSENIHKQFTPMDVQQDADKNPSQTEDVSNHDEKKIICPYKHLKNEHDGNEIEKFSHPHSDERGDANSPEHNDNESGECESPTDQIDEYFKNYSNVVNPYEVAPSALHNYLTKIYDYVELTPEELAEPVFVSANYEDENEDKKKLATEGKTPFQILNEFCQRELKSLPVMRAVERHSQHDFTVEILIKNMKFGIANGDTMRIAKHTVAATTLDIIDHTVLKDDEPSGYLAVFDKIPINDKSVVPTIEEFLPLDIKYPYETLLILLARNFPDFSEADIEYESRVATNTHHPEHEFTMKYKEFVTSGACGDGQVVREVAAQAMLGVVYPQLKWWGSVIRLLENYLEVTQERETRKDMKPNKCIMHVLRKEMKKIAESYLLGK